MDNDNTNLLKLLLLDNSNIDTSKSTFTVDSTNSKITRYIHLNILSRECHYCHTHSLNIHDRIIITISP